MTQLIVNSLYKSFGEQAALREVSLNASEGDIVTVLGHSGSGKSTLLRCINQLEVPDTGSVQLDGLTLDYAQETEARKHALMRKTITQLRSKVAMVFQQFHLWEHMTILQNLIEAPMCVLKKSKQQAIEQAETLLARMGILDKRNHFPAQLSGGQQQRAAIARALMMNPKVMLLDEPTSALDPEMVGEVIKIVLSLAEQGMIVVVSTHEIGFARQIAKQVIFMSNGQVVESGIGPHIFKCPQSEQFKKFLASVHHYSGEHVD